MNGGDCRPRHQRLRSHAGPDVVDEKEIDELELWEEFFLVVADVVSADTDPRVDDLQLYQVLAMFPDGLERDVREDGLDLERGQLVADRLGQVDQDLAGVEAAEEQRMERGKVDGIQISEMD